MTLDTKQLLLIQKEVLEKEIFLLTEKLAEVNKGLERLKPQRLDILCAQPCDDWDCEICADIRK